MKASTISLLIFILSSCTTSHGFVNYKETGGIYSSETAGNKHFEDIGPISASARTFAWQSCDQLARTAVTDLLDIAKARGANAVYNVKFGSGNGLVASPTCSTGWGWFAIYIVGGLGPWVQVTEVEGVAAKLADGKATGAIMIPQGADTSKLAAEWIADHALL